MSKLFYTKNSNKWEKGLPIGNGRLAAMIWDTADSDVLSLNHEHIWTDCFRNRECENSAEYLSIVRKYLSENKFFEATAAANLFFGGSGGGISGRQRRVDSYQPAGNLVFRHNKNEIVKRELNLECGIVKFKRKNTNSVFFSDCVNDIFCFKWFGESLSGELCFEREADKNAEYTYEINENKISFSCIFSGGLIYKVIITLKTDGKTEYTDKGIKLGSATYLTAFVNIFVPEFEDEKTVGYNFDECKKAHTEKFTSLMNRNKFELDFDKKLDEVPTDERIEALRKGSSDNGLMTTYFDFGRYLLLSSNILATLPANLQGKWNLSLTPPWQSDYHTNINLQMNYWMTEAMGMDECVKPLFKYIKDMIPSAKEAAKKLYGCRGVYFPLQGDCWHKSTPESYGYSVWIGAAPWLAQHLWKHYLYTDDIEFLRNEAYPFFKEIAEFYEDYLVKVENGIYQIMPSQSPENRFDGVGKFPVAICISSAMDIELAASALFYASESAVILETDKDKIEIWNNLKNNLPGLSIGNDGRLLEWGSDEFKETEPGHRHLSHLYALYPDDSINQYNTPDLYNACIKSLDVRNETSGDATGSWSYAWSSCIYGKTGNSSKFLENYENLIKLFASDGMINLDDPGIFQIDGNLGAVMAVTEALVSVSGGKVRLLKALPKEWQNGSFKGIKIPGGHTLDFSWENGRITDLSVDFGFGDEISFVINNEEINLKNNNKRIERKF